MRWPSGRAETCGRSPAALKFRSLVAVVDWPGPLSLTMSARYWPVSSGSGSTWSSSRHARTKARRSSSSCWSRWLVLRGRGLMPPSAQRVGSPPRSTAARPGCRTPVGARGVAYCLAIEERSPRVVAGLRRDRVPLSIRCGVAGEGPCRGLARPLEAPSPSTSIAAWASASGRRRPMVDRSTTGRNARCAGRSRRQRVRWAVEECLIVPAKASDSTDGGSGAAG